MGLFSKRAQPPASPEQQRAAQDAAIAAFWSWWLAHGEADAARQFDGHGSPDGLRALADEIGSRVQAIAPLAFETGQGGTARHVLVVTAAGDPDLRGVADRWLAAAPPADDAFEYAAWRRPVPEAADLVIEYGDRPVALGEAAVLAVAEDGKVHVRVSHPQFAHMPDEDRGQVTFLFLDALLGERVVEQSIGEVAWSEVRADGAVPLTALPALVAGLGG